MKEVNTPKNKSDFSYEAMVDASNFQPSSLAFPFSWVGHIHFAAFLINEVKPKVFVELGTHSGNSYFAFCESVAINNLSTKCYAVDTWQGDDHAGKYNNDIYLEVNEKNKKNYDRFSMLLKMTFDEALSRFDDRSVDLLHIDGLHTYEAVKHDFESWLPKLAPGAVVLFHDTQVFEPNFGVWKFWSELQEKYSKSIEFTHSHGLGVIQLPCEDGLNGGIDWLSSTSDQKKKITDYFGILGHFQMDGSANSELNELLKKAEGKLITLEKEYEARIVQYVQHSKNLEDIISHQSNHLGNLNRLITYKLIKPALHVERFLRRLMKTYVSKRVLRWASSSARSVLNILQLKASYYLNKSNSKTNKIIVVSHNANLEGAPILALNLVKVLKEKFQLEVIILLNSGGGLQHAFKMYGKVFRLDKLNHNSKIRLFRELRKSGFFSAFCNTAATGDLLEMLHNNGITCISLIHELPYVIESLKLQSQLMKIQNYSSSVVFPSKYVKDKLEECFGFLPPSYSFKPQGKFCREVINDKKQSRIKLIQMLGLSPESRIVIGVGTGEYRKGIDLFVNTALKVKSIANQQIDFVWVGNIRPDISDYIVGLVESGSIGNIHFVPYTDNIDVYYSGADLFYLSSREDPFPSVYVDALHFELPVIAFENGGGFTDYHKSIGGKLIPSFNIDEAAQEILNELSEPREAFFDEQKRKSIQRDFHFESYARFLLDLIKVDRPTVTVIIPNYNYEKHIQQRLLSIINQTVKPDEILFLDDCSTDNSLLIAERLLKESCLNYKIISNDANNGCYKQWLKGISEASSDILWIAEADDYADESFLETLLKEFSDKSVNLVYCQSIAVDENSREINYSYLDYTKEFGSKRWSTGYKNHGVLEIQNYFSLLNIIPNASGALIRKESLAGLNIYLEKFKYCGDWLTYVYSLRFGKIVHIPIKLNYHRRHATSIIHKSYRLDEFLIEILDLLQYINSNYQISPPNCSLMAKRLCDYYKLRVNKFSNIKDDKILEAHFGARGLQRFWSELK